MWAIGAFLPLMAYIPSGKHFWTGRAELSCPVIVLPSLLGHPYA